MLQALYISLLGLLKLGRLYNTFEFFNRLDLSMTISAVALTILVRLLALTDESLDRD